MARQHSRSSSEYSILPLLLSASLLACSASSSDADAGGSPSTGGRGGNTSAKGGATGSGGDVTTGGTHGAGGIAASGGALAAGGHAGLGGALGTGGSVATGGVTSSGGKTGLGGASATGGGTGSGGASATGGAIGTGGANATGGTPGVDGGGGSTGEFGFAYSKPGSNQVSCNDPSAGTLKQDVPDADWLCTFHVGGKLAYVYAQANTTGAQCIMSLIPLYSATAQISVDGVVSALSSVQYDAGGRHHNDSLQFDYQGKTYKYYHSSFGFGWHACQSMDCLNVYGQGTTVVESEGCTSARTLPEICVPIDVNATHAALVDAFKKCPGDTGN
jgi:hypothetical protein